MSRIYMSSYGKILQPIDADARDFIDQLNTDPGGVHLTAVQRRAVDFLVRGLKGIKDTGMSGSVWERNKTNGAAYPIIGGTEYKHKFNVFNPEDSDGAFRLSFNGGLIHSELGIKPDGTTGYADTNLIPLTNLNINDIHLSFYSQENIIDGFPSGVYPNEIGVVGSNSSTLSLSLKKVGDGAASQVMIGSVSSRLLSNVTDNSLGLFIGNRLSASSLNLFIRGAKLLSNTIPDSTSESPNQSVIIFGQKQGGGLINQQTTRRSSFASIGKSLTDRESIQMNHLVHNYQSILSRNPFYS